MKMHPQSAVRTPLSAPAVGGKACAINSTGLGRRSHRSNGTVSLLTMSRLPA